MFDDAKMAAAVATVKKLSTESEETILIFLGRELGSGAADLPPSSYIRKATLFIERQNAKIQDAICGNQTIRMACTNSRDYPYEALIMALAQLTHAPAEAIGLAAFFTKKSLAQYCKRHWAE